MFPYIQTEDGFTVMIDNRPYSVEQDHAEFDTLLEATKEGDSEKFHDHYTVEKQVGNLFEGTDVTLEDGHLYYGEEQTPLHGTLIDRIVEYIDSDEETRAQPMVNFLDNLMDNPSSRAANELYDFLAHKGIPITDDGCFLAYKTVRNNYHDVYSGKFDNSVGQTIEMRRSKVDDNKNRTCSQDFHVGAWSYAGPNGWYHSHGQRVMVVKVNPRDAVSVPADHDATKLRVCKYEVVDELDTDSADPLDNSYVKCGDCDCDDEGPSVKQPETAAMAGAIMHLANSLKKYEYHQAHQVGDLLVDISDSHKVDRSELRESASMLYDGCERNERVFCEEVVSDRSGSSFGQALIDNMDG